MNRRAHFVPVRSVRHAQADVAEKPPVRSRRPRKLAGAVPCGLAGLPAQKRRISMPWVSGGNAWNVNFDNGNVNNNNRNNNNAVRLVRASQWSDAR